MAVLHASVHDATDQAEPLTVEAAYDRSYRAALTDSEIGTVGLEIETHLVDLDSVADSVAWNRVEPMRDVVRAAVQRSAVTLEPGGQLELSGSPAPDILTAVTELRHDGAAPGWLWPGWVSGWFTPVPTRSGRPAGSTRDRVTGRWSSTLPPPAGRRRVR